MDVSDSELVDIADALEADFADSSDEDELVDFANDVDHGRNDIACLSASDFGFPYEPYPSQLQLMRQLYRILDEGKIGIVESPTGTGKSLCLLCSVLKWIQDKHKADTEELHRLKEDKNEQLLRDSVECDTDDWIEAYRKENEIELAKHDRIDDLKPYLDLDEEIDIKRHEAANKLNERKTIDDNSKKMKSNLNQAKVDHLFESMEDDHTNHDEMKESIAKIKRKVYFATRTHSQISQLIGELNRIDSTLRDRIRAIPLGSRQICCINQDVLALKSTSLINEACQEMFLPGKRSAHGIKRKCPYLTDVDLFSLHCQSKPKDIETIVDEATEFQCCPYYSVRKAMSTAHVVLLPYNILLSEAVRKSYGLDLTDSIVIIDEAHNLIQSLTDTHGSTISLQSIAVALIQLLSYTQRYRQRFNPKSLSLMKQLTTYLEKLIRYCKHRSTDTQVIYSVLQFMYETGIKSDVLSTLLGFVDEAHLKRKLHGFVLAKTMMTDFNHILESRKEVFNDFNTDNAKMNSSNHFQVVISFLEAFLTSSEDSRILIENSGNQKGIALRLLHLDSRKYFVEFVQKCRSIVLAGGTIKPVEDFIESLFEINDRSRIVHAIGNHVVPESNMIVLACCGHNAGSDLDFRFQTRNDAETLNGLARFVLTTVAHVKSGAVFFFHSYEYIRTFVHVLKTERYWEAIEKHKQIITEIDQNPEGVDTIISYSKIIQSDERGALLFAVIGGKLSEGINLADELGRCVCIVGMPYPNMMSVEIQEKIRFLQSKGRPTAKYLDNVCWKAINQTVGRVLRHKDDYAAIILLDRRYTENNMYRPKQNLPDWLGPHLVSVNSSKQCNNHLKAFFDRHRQISR